MVVVEEVEEGGGKLGMSGCEAVSLVGEGGVRGAYSRRSCSKLPVCK